MFQNCYALRKLPSLGKLIPITGTISSTAYSSMFYYCKSVKEIPDYEFAQTTNTSIFTNIFLNSGGNTLSRIRATGFNQNISLSGLSLGADELDEVYTNLPSVTGKTITVTNNWGTASDDPTIATAKGWTVTG
jgi:hypothetical protein